MRQVRVAAAVVIMGLLAVSCGDDSAEVEEGGAVPVEDPDPGDLDIDDPDGWRIVPLADLGFGLALPEEWEDVVLSEEGFALLSEASPQVPDFVTLASDAQAAGAVFYAAGVDPDNPDRLNDLKVLPHLDAVDEVTDAGELEAFAQERLDDDQFDEVELEPVEGWRFPAVDVRYSTTYDDATGEDEEITAHGVDRLVLAPSGMVFSVIVTGEDAAAFDDLVPELLATFDFT